MYRVTFTFTVLMTLTCNALAENILGPHSSCPDIVTKKRWDGLKSIQIEYTLIPVSYVIVHHTVTSTCEDEDGCAKLVRNIQNYHMNNLEYDDIGYNFLVGGDGRIYEGAGWHILGAHTIKYNSKSLGLAFIGDFSKELPNEKQLKAAKDFLKCAEERAEVSDDYKLLGGRQVISTESPGLRLYRELQNWRHYSRTP